MSVSVNILISTIDLRCTKFKNKQTNKQETNYLIQLWNSDDSTNIRNDL